nr:unnamed protein product [Callosobruchus analis]
MDNNDVQLVGGPCGQHGPYTFYKAFKYTKNGVKRIVTLSEFFFVKMWRDSDLLCIGELQLLWTDKNSEQMLASLRLYFLPENTPEGRTDHGEDEVLAISEKVVIKVEDLVTWMTAEAEWSWGRLAKCERDLATTPEVGGAEPPTTPEEEERPKVEGVKEGEVAPPRKPAGVSFAPGDSHLDFGDVENERRIVVAMGKKKANLVECGKCKASITKTQYSLKCAGDCGKWYHKKCSGLSDAQFLAYEKRIANEKWLCSCCASSGLLAVSGESDSSDDENVENPSYGKILKVLNSKFAELEKAITFNGDMMEQLQQTIKVLTEENKKIKKEQDQLKTKVANLEKEVSVMKEKFLKEENESRKKNIIIMGLKGDKDAEINVKKIFTKMEQDGYLPFWNQSRNTNFDGCAVFTKEDIFQKCVLVEHGNVKCLRVSISKCNTEADILALYRSPSTDKGEFIESLSNILHQTSADSKKLGIFAGDININLLDNNCAETNDYLTVMNSFGYNNLINGVTRKTENTASCIDHLFIRCKDENYSKITPVILKRDLTDHYPILLNLKLKNKLTDTTQENKLYSKIDYALLSQTISTAKWDSVFSETNAETSTTNFIESFTNMIKSCTKEYKICNKKVKLKPWITEGLILSIRKRIN